MCPRKLYALPVLVTMLAPAAAAAQTDAYARLSLSEAIRRALERNPLVTESALEVRRAEGAADGVAGILAENPSLSVETGLHHDQGYVGEQQAISARIDQPLDLFGQAGARRQAAGDVVNWAKSRLALVRAEIAARVRVAYMAAQVARTRVELCQERLTVALQTADALKMRVRLGASSDIDLGMAEAESGRAESALLAAQAGATRALLVLRDLLELPASAAATPSDTLAPPPASVPGNEAQEALLIHHLSVKMLEKRRLAVDSEIGRLERERLPRLSFGLTAERPSNEERYVGVGLTFSPALWRRNQGPLAEARVERERVELERATTMAGLERHWVALREEQSRRLQELAAVERTLRDEERVRTLVRAGWEAGRFDFLRVLLAERSVADTKQTRLDLWAELWTNVIEMNRLLGQES